MTHLKVQRLQRLAGLLAMALVSVAWTPSVAAALAMVDPGLMASARQAGTVPVLIVARDQATLALAPLRADASVLTRRRALVSALRARADVGQAGVRRWLDARRIAYRDFWIANVIAARLNVAQLAAVAQRADVASVHADRPIPQHLPHADPVTGPMHVYSAAQSLTWGLEKINVAEAWAHGVFGQDVVVAGEDTGYQWDHPALKSQYRGWDGIAVDHNYNWHDAIHVDNASCDADSPAPCDDDNHGTHTMGTMIGNDASGTSIGVAPQAEWIGCRNMNDGAGTPSSYIECMQWMLAPTDLAGNNPQPALAPDIISNSWGCPASEGCTTGEEIHAAVDNVVAGGIFFAVAAGNDGPACGTINDAPALYSASFVVAASKYNDALAAFSSRGPVAGATAQILDLAAPGVDVYSSIPVDSYDTMQGTSMATPHVAGVAALVMSVNPALRGHPGQVADILRASAVRQGITDAYHTRCGGLTMTDWPNYQAGYGRLDAWAAVRLADTLFTDGFGN